MDMVSEEKLTFLKKEESMIAPQETDMLSIVLFFSHMWFIIETGTGWA
jgi:hypothetical protein